MSYTKRIGDVNGFVNNVANLYTDPLRVLMEYVDNSLDSAAVLREKEGSDSYSRPINISVQIHKANSTKDCEIAILDNCLGMGKEELVEIVQEIGNSRKKHVSWLNGRFGFGVHAYASCCQTVTFITRKRSGKTLKISIDRDSAVVQEERVVSDSALNVETGTLVILSNFKDRATWNQLRPDALCQMIEEHFEFKLREHNLTVEVLQGRESWQCKPFDYNKIVGVPFRKGIAFIEREDGRSNCKQSLNLEPPIEVFLQVSKVPISRPVLFFANGRRICKVIDEKSFMKTSNRKMQLWGHPHLVGFIDVKGHLDPQLDRNGFNTRPWQARSVFEELAKLEDAIDEALQEINEATRNESLDDLSDLISSILSDLARADNLRFRSEQSQGSQDTTVATSELCGVEHTHCGASDTKESGIGGDVDDSVNCETNPKLDGQISSELPGLGGSPVPSEEGEEKAPSAHEKPKVGFNVRFHPMEPPKEDDMPIRSEFAGGEIWIYSEHPEFSRRKSESKEGKIKLTSELISYIAGEVATHYKDEWFNKKKLQLMEHERKRVMQELVEFILNFENKMKPYTGKTADEIGLTI